MDYGLGSMPSQPSLKYSSSDYGLNYEHGLGSGFLGKGPSPRWYLPFTEGFNNKKNDTLRKDYGLNMDNGVGKPSKWFFGKSWAYLINS